MQTLPSVGQATATSLLRYGYHGDLGSLNRLCSAAPVNLNESDDAVDPKEGPTYEYLIKLSALHTYRPLVVWV